MPAALIHKLQQFTRLAETDSRMLRQICSEQIRQIGSREDIIREGDKPMRSM